MRCMCRTAGRVAVAMRSLGNRWRAAWSLAVLTLVTVIVACAQPSAGPEIRVGYAGVLDVGDISAEIAHADLESAGYVVREQAFATIETLVDALARGDVDVGTGAARAFWAASAKGAELRTVMEHVGNVHRLVSQGNPPNCAAAIDRRRLALQSEGAAGTALARAYMAIHCPDVHPEILMVPGSPNRLAAALSGAVDATVLQLSDVARLMRLAPGRFSVTADFSREWPGLMVTGVHVNARFAREQPALVRAYVKARVLANRRTIADRAEALRHAHLILGDSEDWSGQIDDYVLMPAWHAQGGLTRAGVEETLRFLTERSGLDPTLTTARIADLSFLESVLGELGDAPFTP